MKLSVIIPVYNKRDYVRKAVESVLAQTFSDYELIIVDDGSTDGSYEEVLKLSQNSLNAETTLSPADSADFAAMANSRATLLNASSVGEATQSNFTTIGNPVGSQWDDSVRLSGITQMDKVRIIRQANQGVAAARNNGVAVSKGEYVAFLDADDWWAPNYLERMMWLIENYPEAGLYACNYWYVKTGKTHIALDIPTGYFNYPKTYVEQKSMPVTSISVIMLRKVFDEMGGFPLGIKLGEDFLLWSKVALRYKVAFLNEALTYYNNDIPAKLRATRNLHAPERHMLFCMEHLVEAEKTSEDWKRLCDWLRVGGLLEYWMDRRYHDVAAKELEKVDWSQQSARVKRVYKTPIWVLKAKRAFMKLGSWWKQKLIRLIY